MERDLASVELWERSLERSRRRRAQSRSRVTNVQVSAALLAATVAVPAAPAAAQELERGNTGDDVRAVQRALGITADGDFGPNTRRAVLDFQARNGLVVDGIVGPATKRALGLAGAPAPATARGGSSNAATTMAIQRALGIGADGVYGPITRQAVRDLDGDRRLLGATRRVALVADAASTPPTPTSSSAVQDGVTP